MTIQLTNSADGVARVKPMIVFRGKGLSTGVGGSSTGTGNTGMGRSSHSAAPSVGSPIQLCTSTDYR